MKMMKKIAAIASAAVLLVTGTVTSGSVKKVDAAGSYNYAEALQKSMFFYEVQQAGELPDWNMVSWRDDSMLTDEVPGGWFDAGDHFKFTLTNAYTAAVMAWGYLQYKDAVDKAGLGELYKNNLKWGLDYVKNADRGDCIVGTIGDGFDHQWWGSAEVYMRKYELTSGNTERPYDLITDSAAVAECAAALAAGYLVFKDEDPAAAADYLEHAESLFKLADTTRSCDDQGVQKQYYPTTTYFDDLMYAANWLYMATGDNAYLEKCETDYIPNFPREEQMDSKKYTWGFCWDDVTQGAALLYAINTGKSEWKEHIKKHLEYWNGGYGGKAVEYTPDGLAWLMSWGSLRHAENTAFIAEVAADTIFSEDEQQSAKWKEWAKGQMDYAFGDNDLGMCYVQGMGDKNPTTFHHRTASGIHDDHWQSLGLSEEEAEGWQTEYAHTLYGALEGGPSLDGTFTDKVDQYQYTEVAIDYNAGFTACLCALIDQYGGQPLADFPPQETPKWNEFEVTAVVQQNQPSYTQIQLWAMNHTAWPARVVKDLSYNYYFDITEVLEAGLKPEDITVSVNYDQHASDEGKLSVSGPFQYKDNIYYIKASFADGRVVMPTGQSEHRAEAQIRIAIPDAIDGKSTAGAWDPTNDWSFEGLKEGGQELLKSDEALAPHITMYDGENLVWGEEPDGTTPKPYTPDDDPKVTTTAVTTAALTTTTTTTITDITTVSEDKTTTSTTPTTAPIVTTDPIVTTTDNSGGNKDKDPVDPTRGLTGDIDLNGVVEIADLILFNKSFVNAAVLSDAQLAVADCYDDGTGEINAMDVVSLLRRNVNVITSLPERP